MATRQTAGMMTRHLRLAGPDWSVPDFSTLRRRQKTLAVRIPYRRVDGRLSLIVPSWDIAARCSAGDMDSTGIKFRGDCEWQTRQHGSQGRREWRKVLLAMDTVTSDVRAVEFMPGSDGDSPVLPELPGQVPEC